MHTSPIHVLILEDNSLDAELMVDELHQAGFEVDWQRVDTPTEYVAHLDPTPDLILADYRLPQFTALDALHILQAQGVDVPLIVVSGTVGDDIAVAAIKHGAVDYLLKDRLARLGPAVESALEAKRLRDQRRQAQAALRASEIRYRAMIEKASEAILLVGPDRKIAYASPSTQNVTGYAPEERTGHGLFDLTHPDDLDATRSRLDMLAHQPGESTQLKLRILHKDGSWRWIEGVATNLLDEPSVGAIVINYRDITERQRHEQRIHTLNRLYAVLSDMNQVIVRIRSLPALFEKVCQIAVDKGAFRMAWIGLLTPSGQNIQKAAEAGVVGNYLSNVSNTEDQPQLLFWDILLAAEHAVYNDVEHDPRLEYWPERDEALQLGYRAMAKFPLTVAGKVRGIFNLYSGEPGFFDADEMKLLDEMALDLSFAIEIADREAQRQEADASLNLYARKMEVLHDIDTALLEASSVQLLCETVMQKLPQLIPCRRASIGLVNETTTEVVIFAVYQDPPSALGPGTRLLADPVFMEQFRAKSVYVVDDLRTLPNLTPGWQQFIKEGIVSLARILIMAKGQPIGFLTLGSDTPGFFTAEHEEFASIVVNHLALAIQQMRLSETLADYANELAQKVAERTAELQSAKERVEVILNNSLNGILLVHADLRIQQMNAASRTLLACDHDEYLNRSLLDVIDARDVNQVSAALRDVVEEGAGRHVEIRVSRRDGTTFDAELSMSYVSAPDTEVDGFVCTIRDITKRKQAEQALVAKLEQEQEFQKYLKDLHEITIELTPIDGLDEFYRRVVELSLERFGFDRMALFLHGEEPGTATGTFGTDPEGRLVDEHHILFTLTPQGIMARAMERVERFCCDEGRPLLTDQQPVGTGWNAAAVLWDGTKTLGWLVADNLLHHRPASKALMDILSLYSLSIGTLLARKRVEAALRDSESRLRESQQMLGSLLESIPVRVFWKDLNSVYLGCNRLMAQDAGLNSSEEIVGKTDVDMPWCDLAAAYQADDRALLESRLPRLQIEETLTIADGSRMWFQANKIPMLDSSGEITGIIGAYIEITKRKQAQEALRTSEARFRSVVETAPNAIMIIDLQGVIVMVNPATLRDSGYDQAAMVGHCITEFASPASQIAFANDFPRLLKNGTIRQEVEFVHRDGSVVILDCSGAVIYDEDRQPQSIIVLGHDITKRKQAEEALRQAFEKEKELSELKSRFVSMASHEFRNPLATILATAETLSAYRAKMTEQQIAQRLNNIQEQVGHLKDIMEDVLQLARLQARRAEFNPVMLNLDGLCRTILDEFQSRPDIKHDIRYTCDEGLPEANLDKHLMRQIVGNLVSNAIKYSSDDHPITVCLAWTSDALILRVQDEGMGIPEADLKHLFEPFHRAANVGTIAGTGLGLTIAREAIDLHGGTIAVESRLGAGTTFTVSIPLITRGTHDEDKNPGD